MNSIRKIHHYVTFEGFFQKNMSEYFYKTNLNKTIFINSIGNPILDKIQYTSCVWPKNCRRGSNFKIATTTIAAWHFLDVVDT